MNIDMKCEICSAQNFTKVQEDGGYQIYGCANCGLIFADLGRGKVDFNFEEAHGIEYWEDTKEGSKYNFDLYQKTHIYYKNVINNLPCKTDENIKLIDIGCGFGFFLKCVEKDKIDGSGVDLSVEAIDYAKKILGLEKVYCGDILKHKFSNDSFDVATAFNLLEHVPEPRRVVAEAHKVLRKGGFILIRVPNAVFHSFILKLTRLLSFNKKADYSVLAIPPPYHLYGFSGRNLTLLLESVGFHEVSISPSPLSEKPGWASVYYPVASKLFSFIYCISLKQLNLGPTIDVTAQKR